MRFDTGSAPGWDPWQLEAFADAFAGTRELWSVVPEGSGKTSMLSAFALYHADHVDAANVPIAARDRDQAQQLLRVAGDIVRRSPGMAKRFKLLVNGSRVIRALRTGGEIKVFASTEGGGDGVIPTLAILDELHLHRDLALYATWRGKLGKRDALLWVISTAGDPDGEFEQARARAQEGADTVAARGAHRRSVKGRVVVHDWALPEGADPLDLDEVLAMQPSSLITREDLQDKLDAPGFRLGNWLRRSCNRPAREHATAVAEADWAACAAPDCRVPVSCERPVIGLDLAWRVDSTGIVLAGWGDGDLEGRIVVDREVVEVVPPMDGSTTRLEEVLGPILRLGERFGSDGVVTIAMDPSKEGHTIAQAFEDPVLLGRMLDLTDGQLAGLPRFEVVEIPQRTPGLVRMTAATLEAIRDRVLAHPNSPTLTRHLMAGTLDVAPLGDVRFDRPRRGPRAAIDCATAMLHAVDQVTVGAVARPKPLDVSSYRIERL